MVLSRRKPKPHLYIILPSQSSSFAWTSGSQCYSCTSCLQTSVETAQADNAQRPQWSGDAIAHLQGCFEEELDEQISDYINYV